MIKKFLPIIVTMVFGAGVIMANSQFELSSNTIKNGQTLNQEQIYKGFGCTGENISPDLKWSGAPDGTKSYALLVYDPDAPTPHGWWHWLVVNIPADKTELEKGEKPQAPAIETITDFKTTGYGGACPPVGHGVHRYNFTIYALDTEKLDITPDTNPNTVEKTVKEHALASAVISAVYQR